MRGHVFGSSGPSQLFGASVPNSSTNDWSSDNSVTNTISQQYGNHYTNRTTPNYCNRTANRFTNNSISDDWPHSIAHTFAIRISYRYSFSYWLPSAIHEPKCFTHANHKRHTHSQTIDSVSHQARYGLQEDHGNNGLQVQGTIAKQRIEIEEQDIERQRIQVKRRHRHKFQIQDFRHHGVQVKRQQG